VIRLPYHAVFRELLRRELGERYRNTLLGGGWYLVLPLLQLAVLAWVFGSLLPRHAADGAVPYPVFLALGLWPWSLFANAALRSATVLVDNASLIGKIAVPHEVYVHARAAASVLVDLGGFVAVLLVVLLAGVRLHPAGIPAAFAGLGVMLLMALGVSRLLAVLQVFLRDTATAIGQLLSLGFFLCPIVYDRNQLPPAAQRALDFNPFTAPIETVRHALLGQPVPWSALAISALVAVLVYALANWLSARTRAHLEDFL
jgi:lipopolysaccharide transport system permease protein